ncbi:MAG: YgiT-type zinc finger protein [Candidatus Thiothrix moscowensis]|nr:YgiT-type zinc finger protein [Candidatus Thiothrix moscowensis]
MQPNVNFTERRITAKLLKGQLTVIPHLSINSCPKCNDRPMA